MLLKQNNMKSQVVKIENVEATEFTMEANALTLDTMPTIEEQNELFNNDDSIILEF